MGLFSKNKIKKQNIEILKKNGLVSKLGVKFDFSKFLVSKNMSIKKDIITQELIDEFIQKDIVKPSEEINIETTKNRLDPEKLEKVRNCPFVNTTDFDEIIEKGLLDEEKLDMLIEKVDAAYDSISNIKLKVTVNGKDIKEYSETEEEKRKRKNINTKNFLTSQGINIPSYSSPYDFEEDEEEEE